MGERDRGGVGRDFCFVNGFLFLSGAGELERGRETLLIFLCWIGDDDGVGVKHGEGGGRLQCGEGGTDKRFDGERHNGEGGPSSGNGRETFM